MRNKFMYFRLFVLVIIRVWKKFSMALRVFFCNKGDFISLISLLRMDLFIFDREEGYIFASVVRKLIVICEICILFSLIRGGSLFRIVLIMVVVKLLL